MTKLEWADAIAKALEHVPVPLVADVAMAADAILSAVEADRQINLADPRSILQQAAAAKAPWQAVHDRATGNTGE